ncbi:DUF86 domain-containing protein [Halobacterium salinarum]|uniref:HepT-like ribonuclease domain-containing protein n=1 Tax=Halorubrum miltondacostae TaxID=3076378 RepID=A0ABD5M6H7_9EURY|nr:HepT-like ribonuclease domain-containing protein [Halobacterium salinarum]MDL0138921.1 DUF86 domain-containing protein [Halobacterium salinarum]
MTEVLDYLDDILEAVEKIERFTEGMDYAEFVEDSKTVDSLLRNFEVIDEAAKNVPESDLGVIVEQAVTAYQRAVDGGW